MSKVTSGRVAPFAMVGLLPMAARGKCASGKRGRVGQGNAREAEMAEDRRRNAHGLTLWLSCGIINEVDVLCDESSSCDLICVQETVGAS